MKNYILLTAMAISLMGCSKDHDKDHVMPHPQLGTIKFAAFEESIN